MYDFEVSVLMLAYNHEKYIATAIESILCQKTTFGLHLYIGEDSSTDGTRDVIELCVRKHPDSITLITSEANVGVRANYLRTLKELKGKYVAICEGDDYWIDSKKILRQVKYMERNKNCVICYHPAYLLTPDGETSTVMSGNRPRYSFSYDLAEGNFIPTVSTMFRNTPAVYSHPIFDLDLPACDWATSLILSKEGGSIVKLKKVMAVYRYGTGTWSSNTQSKNINSTIKMIDMLLASLKVDERTERNLKKYRAKLTEDLAQLA